LDSQRVVQELQIGGTREAWRFEYLMSLQGPIILVADDKQPRLTAAL